MELRVDGSRELNAKAWRIVVRVIRLKMKCEKWSQNGQMRNDAYMRVHPENTSHVIHFE